jgi:hypothetical protein
MMEECHDAGTTFALGLSEFFFPQLGDSTCLRNTLLRSRKLGFVSLLGSLSQLLGERMTLQGSGLNLELHEFWAFK